MTTQKIVFFDLASKDGNKCWSRNPWKTRFVLNFKGLDYDTEFLEYPNLKTRLEPHLSESTYTSPTIQYTDGRYIRDSSVIAQVIEKDHPEPSLHLDSPYLAKVEQIIDDLTVPTQPEYIPVVPKRLLNEASVPYWHKTRSAKVGMELDELEKTKGGDQAWAQAEPFLKQATELLKENPDGPFFEGKTVGYADLMWAGFLIFWRRIGEDKYSELLKRSGDAKVHEDLVKAVEPWSKRDGH